MFKTAHHYEVVEDGAGSLCEPICDYGDSSSEKIKLEKEADSSSEDSTPYRWSTTFLIFFFPALGGLLFGYDIGATSAVLSQLKSSSFAGVKWCSLVQDSSVLQGTITSISMLGAMFGSLICFQIADNVGRKRTLIVASLLFIVGALFEVLSGNKSYEASSGLSLLILGRIIYGFGFGFAMHGAPAYIGEMAPTQIRGFLVSMKEVFIVLGMVLGYSIGYVYASSAGGWIWTYGWSILFSAIMFLGMLLIPYSARWLALKGRLNEAKESLQFVSPNISDEKVKAIFDTVLSASDSQLAASRSTGCYDERLFGPTILPALIAGVGLVFFQQVTGQPSVLYYTVSIFEDVGLDTRVSIYLALFKLMATLFTTFTVDNYGRKFLLFLGCGMMLCALISLVIAFIFPYTSSTVCNSYSEYSTCPSTCSWSTTCGQTTCDLNGYTADDCTCCNTGPLSIQKIIILVSLFVYIGGYQIGFGPISWILISEIFPLEVRGKAVSIAVVSNFFWNTVMSFSFAVEIGLIGNSFTFLIYAIILAMSIVFIHYRVPETKGLSLEQIEKYFLKSSLKSQNGGV